MGSVPVANPTPSRKLRLSRRSVLLTLAFVVSVAAILVVLAFAWPNDSAEPAYEWVRVGQVSDFRVNEPTAIEDHHLYLVRLESGGVLALSRRSTHLGCAINWRPDLEFQGRKGWFRDPCGGSNWAVDGSMVSGPAPRGMDRYPLAVVGGEVIVDVRNRLCGPGLPNTSNAPCLPADRYRGIPQRR